MTPNEAAATARQLAALLHVANDSTSDLEDRDALDRASSLLELGQRLAGELAAHCDVLALEAVRRELGTDAPPGQ